VHSGDSVTIERDVDFKLLRVFLSSIKAPKHNHDVQEDFGWESKESLRKLAIGKKVRCVIEYTKTTENKIQMTFASVFLANKQEKNLAAKQLERGLARSSLNKEHLSRFLEDLLSSEKKAIEAKLCIHSKREPPKIVFNDLTQDVKLAKAYEQMLSKRTDRKFTGVVEYCFSGMRFKIRLESENCQIALNLLGVATTKADKNQPALMEYANDALAFAKEHLF
jgi:staphylococcal nuclease domain-containing protein 1